MQQIAVVAFTVGLKLTTPPMAMEPPENPRSLTRPRKASAWGPPNRMGATMRLGG